MKQGWFPYEAATWTERCVHCKAVLVDGAPVNFVWGNTSKDMALRDWKCRDVNKKDRSPDAFA